MAEALGIAASGIAVAQLSSQVGGAVFKLKQLWDEVKDVPEDIADLMEQIDCLGPVFWEAENNFDQSGLPSIVWDQLASKSTTMYCRKALGNLTQMVNELSRQIGNPSKSRRKIAAAKVLLKKDLLKKLERRLENAVRMLTLAQQSYLVALTRAQPDIIVQKFEALTVSCSHAKFQTAVDLNARAEEPERPGIAMTQPNITNGITHLNPPRRQGRSINPGIFGRFLVDSGGSTRTFLFQAPTWLSRRSWEVHSMRAVGAWQWNLRSYSVLPWDSRTLKVARRESPKDMQQLFDAGLASPYDEDESGRTLLHYAVLEHNFEMTKFLISIGIDPLNTCDRRWSPFIYRPAPIAQRFFRALLADRNFAKKTLVYEEEDLQTMPSKCFCRVGVVDFEVYRALLPYQCPLHQNTSLESRVSSAKIALKAGGSAEVVKFMLQPEWNIDPRNICTMVGSRDIFPDYPLVLSMASWLSNLLCGRQSNEIPPGNETNTWFQFAVEVIRHTPDVHVTSFGPYPRLTTGKNTALTIVLFKTLSSFVFLGKAVNRTRTFVMWLRVIRQAGIDLNTYGEYEHQHLVNSNVSQEIMRPLNSTYGCSPSVFRIVGFTYGSEPEDWEVFWNEPTDQFAGHFWRLIEDPPVHIPGSWDDDYSNRRYYYIDDD